MMLANILIIVFCEVTKEVRRRSWMSVCDVLFEVSVFMTVSCDLQEKVTSRANVLGLRVVEKEHPKNLGEIPCHHKLSVQTDGRGVEQCNQKLPQTSNKSIDYSMWKFDLAAKCQKILVDREKS